MIHRILKSMSRVKRPRAPMPVARAPTWRRQQRPEADPDELLPTKQHSGSRSPLHREPESAKTEAQVVEKVRVDDAVTLKVKRRRPPDFAVAEVWRNPSLSVEHHHSPPPFSKSGGLLGSLLCIAFATLPSYTLFSILSFSLSFLIARHVIQPCLAGCGRKRAQSPSG